MSFSIHILFDLIKNSWTILTKIFTIHILKVFYNKIFDAIKIAEVIRPNIYCSFLT